MPLISVAPGPSEPQPKYPIDANALLIRRGSVVYVAFETHTEQARFTQHQDVRLLTAAEATQFESSLPFPLRRRGPARPAPMRLGDVVHVLTTRLGIAACGGCRKRRRLLNNAIIWGWWRRPAS